MFELPPKTFRVAYNSKDRTKKQKYLFYMKRDTAKGLEKALKIVKDNFPLPVQNLIKRERNSQKYRFSHMVNKGELAKLKINGRTDWFDKSIRLTITGIRPVRVNHAQVYVYKYHLALAE